MRSVGDRFGAFAVRALARIADFLRANLLVWIGILLALFVYYFVLDRQGL